MKTPREYENSPLETPPTEIESSSVLATLRIDGDQNDQGGKLPRYLTPRLYFMPGKIKQLASGDESGKQEDIRTKNYGNIVRYIKAPSF